MRLNHSLFLKFLGIRYEPFFEAFRFDLMSVDIISKFEPKQGYIR